MAITSRGAQGPLNELGPADHAVGISPSQPSYTLHVAGQAHALVLNASIQGRAASH